PNPCPQPGACCYFGGSCADGMFEKDCTKSGGSWQGAQTTCDSVNCPTNPCDDSLYSTGGPDGRKGYISYRNPYTEGIMMTAFTLDQEIVVQDLHWYDIETEFGFVWTGTSDYMILDSDGGGGSPGTQLAGGSDISDSRLDTGTKLFSA